MSNPNTTAAGPGKGDTVVRERSLPQPSSPPSDCERQNIPGAEDDVFGDEEGAEIQYKTCKWWYVFYAIPTCIMCASTASDRRHFAQLSILTFILQRITDLKSQECRHS